MDWILDHLIGHIFPFKKIVHGPKLELKRMRYQQNFKTLIKCFTFFFFFIGQKGCFLTNFVQKNCTNWVRIGAICLIQHEVWGLNYLPQKGLDKIDYGLEEVNFSRKNVIEFHTLRHLSSGCLQSQSLWKLDIQRFSWISILKKSKLGKTFK